MAKKKSWFTAVKKDATRGEISILSDIGAWGVSAQDFHASLGALGPVDELEIVLSSDGGDVTTGFAIYDMLARHTAYKVVRVQGLAASMASVVAMVGDEVVMPANSMLMIHNPWGSVTGESEQLKSFANALEMMQSNITDAYVKRTGMDAAEVADMMRAETWLDAAKAVKLGFADRVEDPMEVAGQRYNLTKFNKVPKSFGAALKEKATMTTQINAEENGNDAAAGNGAAAAEDATAIRAAYVATVKEIRSLCKLAGKADLADKYIEDDMTVSAVIEALAKIAAEAAVADAASGTSAHHTVGADVQPKAVDSLSIYGRFNKR